MELLFVVVLGLLGIAAATAIGPRLGVAAPLLLVIVGVIVSFLPFIPEVEVDPEWILAGVLPPLLYSASVAMPSMEFRREFSAISGFSVALVVISSVVLGFVFAAIVPGLGIAGGIALGAIVSPTDAVATSIVKRVGVTPRIVTVLEGESLLNDATALVLLRSAIAAGAASLSFWDIAGDFLWSVAVAVVLGYVVGRANLWVRSRVGDSAVNTVISLTVPFLASIPAEALGASGLVAAVVAGLVTGRGAIRSLPPQHRASDVQTWRTVELVLEGGVFLVMGLEMAAILDDLSGTPLNWYHGGLLALLALAVVLLVRAAYVFPALAVIARRNRRGEQLRPRLTAMADRMDSIDVDTITAQIATRAAEVGRPGERGRGRKRTGGPGQRPPNVERVRRFRIRLRRKVADLDYFLAVPLGWREGTVIVWAGMRGAVTLAAAQTLPADTPARSLLVLTAFFVAAISLIGQGGSLPWLVRVVKPAGIDHPTMERERADIDRLLRQVRDQVHQQLPADLDLATPEGRMTFRMETIVASRAALLAARDDGLYSSAMLSRALDTLDADQISLELRAEGDAEAAA